MWEVTALRGWENFSVDSFPDPASMNPHFLLGPSFIVVSLEPPYTWFTESVSVAQCIVVELQPPYFLDLSAH